MAAGLKNPNESPDRKSVSESNELLLILAKFPLTKKCVYCIIYT